MAQKDLLIVADDPEMSLSLKEMLFPEGYSLDATLNGVAALGRLREDRYQVILSDLQMPGLSGIQFLKEVQGRCPDTLLVFIAGRDQMDEMAEALRLGAYDYLTRPIDGLRLRLTLQRAMEQRKLKASFQSLQRRLKPWECNEKLVFRDPRMGQVLELAHAAADTLAPVLITGESGTGKYLLARCLHDHSSRRAGPFVRINCGSLTGSVLEGELFGQKAGNGTGREKRGKFAEAQGGTIFLDDINGASLVLQARLLSVLQDKVITVVGGNDAVPVDIRFIAATGTSLREEVVRQRFREDLYRHLRGVSLDIPPLRERIGDIEPLCQHFILQFNEMHHKQVKGMSLAALQSCLRYSWPGNIRELESAMERAVILSSGEVITPGVLPSQLRDRDTREAPQAPDLTLDEALARYEKQILLKTLEHLHWNRQYTARALGISRTTLFNKMRRFALLKS